MAARRNRALLAVFSALFAMPAAADDWSGFYGGASAGYQSMNADWTLIQNAGNEISGRIGDVITSNDGSGFLGGVHVGYNHQWGSFVAGVEGEVSVLSADGYSTWTNEAGLFRDASLDHNWMAAVSARAGFVFNEGRNLAYGKLGVAAINADYVHTGGSAATPRILRGDASSVGVLLGVGLEHEISDNVALRLEYDFINTPSDNISLTQGNRTAIFGVDQDVHLIRAGIVFRFGN